MKSKWLLTAVFFFSASLFFWLGSFSEQFTSGQCYSHSIRLIASAVAKTNSPVELAVQLNSLPLYGYETVCSEVMAAAEKLPNASAP